MTTQVHKPINDEKSNQPIKHGIKNLKQGVFSAEQEGVPDQVPNVTPLCIQM